MTRSLEQCNIEIMNPAQLFLAHVGFAAICLVLVGSLWGLILALLGSSLWAFTVKRVPASKTSMVTLLEVLNDARELGFEYPPPSNIESLTKYEKWLWSMRFNRALAKEVKKRKEEKLEERLQKAMSKVKGECPCQT